MLSDKFDFLDFYNPHELAKQVAARLRNRRLEENLTQESLSRKSGVSLGTLKRFESKHEISLRHLLMLAVVLGAGEEFTGLFPLRPSQNIDELLKSRTKKTRQRGRKQV